MRLFTVAVMLCSFFISLEYAITRPASSAIFLSYFSAAGFPYVWLLTVPINLFIVTIYNRLISKWGCLKTFSITIFSVITLNTLTGAFVKNYPDLSFIHVIFKDIYILLMFKQLWSLIHSTIDTSKAKYLYGFLFGIGGFGSVIGSLVPGFFAVELGSSSLFYFTAPIYLCLLMAYMLALKQSDFTGHIEEKSKAGAFKMVFTRPYLTMILLIVVFMQMSAAFVHYQFNALLELNIQDLDLRTEYTGRVFGAVNIFTTLFQVLGGFVLLHFLGLKNSHRLVPMLLLINAVLFVFMPTFSMITFSLICIKSADHSVFGIIREMLYIPLSSEEKFKAKAVIDVFAYRSAKAFASVLLLLFQYFTTSEPIMIVSVLSIVIFLTWSSLVMVMFKKKLHVLPN